MNVAATGRGIVCRTISLGTSVRLRQMDDPRPVGERDEYAPRAGRVSHLILPLGLVGRPLTSDAVLEIRHPESGAHGVADARFPDPDREVCSPPPGRPASHTPLAASRRIQRHRRSPAERRLSQTRIRWKRPPLSVRWRDRGACKKLPHIPRGAPCASTSAAPAHRPLTTGRSSSFPIPLPASGSSRISQPRRTRKLRLLRMTPCEAFCSGDQDGGSVAARRRRSRTPAQAGVFGGSSIRTASQPASSIRCRAAYRRLAYSMG